MLAYFSRLRLKNHLAVAKQPNAGTILFHSKLLKQLRIPLKPTKVGTIDISIHTTHYNVMSLLDTLQLVVIAVESKQMFDSTVQPTRVDGNMFTKTLDEWLVTQKNIPIKPHELTPPLSGLMLRLSKALTQCDDRHVNYYLRQVTDLLEDVREVSSALLRLR